MTAGVALGVHSRRGVGMIQRSHKGNSMSFMKKLRVFKKDESGASMVEYGVALLVVAAIGIGLMNTLGTVTSANVQAACTNVNGGTACTP